MRGPCRTSLLALGLGAALAYSAPAQAADFKAASEKIDARLESSLKELAQERDQIAKEKLPLSRSVAKLESQVLALRRERDERQKVRDSRTIDLSSLQKQVASLQEQSDFVDSRLDEFVRDFEGRLDISELPNYEKLTAAAKLAVKDANLDAVQKRDRRVAVVQAAVDRLEAQLGGQVYPGEALSPGGLLTKGTFVSMGPSTFFVSDDGKVAGLVETQLNAADPVVVALPGGLASGLASIASEGHGELPFDATLGKALRVEKARKGLMEYVREGGYVGYVIIVLGFAAVVLTAFKAFEILGFRLAQQSDVDSILDELSQGNREAAAERAQHVPGVAGEMLAAGVQHADEKRGLLEELLFEQILRARPRLERFLPFLAITAAASPLLGLLGTVVGMIKTFQLITIFGTGDAKSLSSGISEALVTTALGLIIAIPVLILHGSLSRMARRKLGLLEEISIAFVNGVSSIRHRFEQQGT